LEPYQPMTIYGRIALAKDDPAYLHTYLSLDPYRIQNVTVLEEKTSTETMSRTMKAVDARELGLEVDPNIPDEKMIHAEWTEEQVEIVPVQKTLLRYRKKSRKARTNRPKTVRPELAGAAADPYKLIQHKRLISLVNDEISYWMSHHIPSSGLHPLILILLGANEQADGGHVITNRNTFRIIKFSNHHITAEDHKGDLYEIDLDEGVVESGIIRRFTLFLPANAVFKRTGVKQNTKKLVPSPQVSSTAQGSPSSSGVESPQEIGVKTMSGH
jgi:hypothetical protein